MYILSTTILSILTGLAFLFIKGVSFLYLFVKVSFFDGVVFHSISLVCSFIYSYMTFKNFYYFLIFTYIFGYRTYRDFYHKTLLIYPKGFSIWWARVRRSPKKKVYFVLRWSLGFSFFAYFIVLLLLSFHLFFVSIINEFLLLTGRFIGLFSYKWGCRVIDLRLVIFKKWVFPFFTMPIHVMKRVFFYQYFLHEVNYFLRKWDIIILNHLKMWFYKLVDWYWYLAYHFGEVKRLNIRRRIYYFFVKRKLLLFHSLLVVYTLLKTHFFEFCRSIFSIYILHFFQYITYIYLKYIYYPFKIYITKLKIFVILPFDHIYKKNFDMYFFVLVRIYVAIVMYILVNILGIIKIAIGSFLSQFKNIVKFLIKKFGFLFTFFKNVWNKRVLFPFLFISIFWSFLVIFIALAPIISLLLNTPLLNSYEYAILPVKGSPEYYDAFMGVSDWNAGELAEMARRANLIPDIYKDSLEYYDIFMGVSDWNAEELRELARRTPYLPDASSTFIKEHAFPHGPRKLTPKDVFIYLASIFLTIPLDPNLSVQLAREFQGALTEHTSEAIFEDIISDPATATHKLIFYVTALVGAALILSGYNAFS